MLSHLNVKEKRGQEGRDKKEEEEKGGRGRVRKAEGGGKSRGETET